MNRNPLLTALLVVVALLLAFGAGRAGPLPRQDAPAGQVAAAFLDDLAGQVALTPDEHAAALAIMTEQTAKRQALVQARLAEQSGAAGLMGLRKDLRALAADTDARLAAVLPREKMEIVRAYLEKRRQQARQRFKAVRQQG